MAVVEGIRIPIPARVSARGPCKTYARRAGMAGAKGMYLDVKVLVDFDRVTEETDVLGQICELPHVAQLLQCAGLFNRRLGLHFVGGAFSRRHGCGASRAATRVSYVWIWCRDQKWWLANARCEMAMGSAVVVSAGSWVGR